MIQKIFLALLFISLFFIDINTIGLPYIGFVFGYIAFMLYKKRNNELILAFTLFGYSFTLFINRITGVTNLALILAFISLFFGIQIFLGVQKLKLKFHLIIILYLLFFLLIFYSFFEMYSLSYQLFKFQLLITWSLIFIISFLSYDRTIYKFNFEHFLIIGTFLFIPHFSNAEYDESTLSPKQVWSTFSVLDDGIRGHNFDIITATRIAGVGVLAFIIYLLDFSIKKTYLITLIVYFGVMIVICQTRQSIAALSLPLFLFFIYNYLKNSRNYFGVIVGTLFSLFSIYSYISYTESEGVESRIVTSTDGSSNEGTGREAMWAKAISYIEQEGGSIGFGNHATFVRPATYPHNIFLEVYIEMGVISFMLLIGIFILIIYEIFKVFFIYKSNTKLELFLILATVYYFGLAQFSVDLPRNLTFLYTFILYIYLKHFNHIDEDVQLIEEATQKSTSTKF